MKNRNKNKEVNPKHQKQVHEKKRQNLLWKPAIPVLSHTNFFWLF
jgi:hypothetical protein